MTGWIVLGVIVAVLLLIAQIRLGGRAVFGPEGFFVSLLAGPFKIRIFPLKEGKEKKEKPGKEKRAKKKEPTETQLAQKKGGTVGRILSLLPVVGEAAGALKRKIRIDELKLRVVWGAEDAAGAAMGYGKANALLGMVYPLIDNNFKVKSCDFQVDVDYGRTEPEFSADAAITMTLGQLLSFALHYGAKLLIHWVRSGKRAEE